MSDLTYDDIAPLIADQKQDTNVLAVTFRCPQTGREVTADALLESSDGVGSSVRDAVKREASWNVFSLVARWISRLFGGGIAGSMAGSIGGDIAYDQVSERGEHIYSKKQKQAAALRAFESVRDQFVFDEASKQWLART